jgi:hypothetical protein
MDESDRRASVTARKSLIAGWIAIVGVLLIAPTRGLGIKRETAEDTVLPALAMH